MCGKGQKLRIISAEFGRPFEKPICMSRSLYNLDYNVFNHEKTNLKPFCASADLYPYLKESVLLLGNLFISIQEFRRENNTLFREQIK